MDENGGGGNRFQSGAKRNSSYRYGEEVRYICDKFKAKLCVMELTESDLRMNGLVHQGFVLKPINTF